MTGVKSVLLLSDGSESQPRAIFTMNETLGHADATTPSPVRLRRRETHRT